MVKKLRSLLHEYFPEELRFQIELLSKRRDITNKEKQDELFKLLREFEIENISPLGSGTNRYAFKMNGFAIKVATDHDGKIDNMKEFKMAKRLFPYVTKTYEISQNGTLLVAEYIQPFASYGEMLQYADKIREILTKLSNVYLIGDVGVTSKNYANWGIRIGSDEPVCLDFAYVYDVKSELFICSACKNNSMIIPNKDFTELICPAPNCGHKYKFEDIRRKLGNDIHNHEIGDLSDEGYLLYESNVETTLDPERSNYLALKEPKKETKVIQEKQEEIFDAFILDRNIEDYLREDINMKQNSMIITSGAMNFHTPVKIKAKAVSVKSNLIDNNDDSGLAFSGDISIKATAVVTEKEIPVDPDDEPISEALSDYDSYEEESIPQAVTAQVVSDDEDEEDMDIPEMITEIEPEQPDELILDDKFKRNINKAISKLSNTIKTEIYHRSLYDNFAGSLIEKIYPEKFYDTVQNCVFRSLTNYLNLTQIEAPNMNRPGTHKEWVLQDLSIIDKCANTLEFLQSYFLDMEINQIEEPSEMLEAFGNKYGFDMGLDQEWIPYLIERLKLKLKMTSGSHERLANEIASNWVKASVEESVVDEEPIELVNTVEEAAKAILEEKKDMKITSPVNIADSVIENVADEAEEVFSSEILTSWNDVKEELDDDEDEETDSEESLKVEIYLNDDDTKAEEDQVDNIRVLTGDYNGYIEIPFYTKLSNESSEDLNKNSSDKITRLNGVWNWVSYIVPDKMFKTKNPEYWINNINPMDSVEEDMVLCLCLKERPNGEFIMGIYEFSGAFYVDPTDGVDFIQDMKIYHKLNNYLSSMLSYIGVSQVKYITNYDDDIIDEQQMIELFNFEDVEISEQPSNLDADADATEIVNEVIAEESNDLEDAAIQALTGTSEAPAAPTQNDHLVYTNAPAEEYEEVETFVPIRKKNKKK